jgi:CheY-like chemotaxis protein
VLVVDDCRDTTWSFQALLELWGYEAEAAHDGESAVAAALARTPDVVLLDLGMPVVDGFEVARRLRRQRPTECVCLIAVSGFTDGRRRALAAAAGIDLFLAKPVDPDVLQSLLREIVIP